MTYFLPYFHDMFWKKPYWCFTFLIVTWYVLEEITLICCLLWWHVIDIFRKKSCTNLMHLWPLICFERYHTDLFPALLQLDMFQKKSHWFACYLYHCHLIFFTKYHTDKLITLMSVHLFQKISYWSTPCIFAFRSFYMFQRNQTGLVPSLMPQNIFERNYPDPFHALLPRYVSKEIVYRIAKLNVLCCLLIDIFQQK